MGTVKTFIKVGDRVESFDSVADARARCERMETAVSVLVLRGIVYDSFDEAELAEQKDATAEAAVKIFAELARSKLAAANAAYEEARRK